MWVWNLTWRRDLFVLEEAHAGQLLEVVLGSSLTLQFEDK